MKDELDLLKYCKPCGYKCCTDTSGSSPRLNEDEKNRIESERGSGFLIKENNYWIISHDSRGCVFLTKEGLCSIHEIKPVDCRIFPLDPVYTKEGEIDWVIVENCPAAKHLTAEYYAKAIVLGTGWISKTYIQSFNQYWKKHKETNSEQNIVKLEDFLSDKEKSFLVKIKVEIEKLTDENFAEWIKKNKSPGLEFLDVAVE